MSVLTKTLVIQLPYALTFLEIIAVHVTPGTLEMALLVQVAILTVMTKKIFSVIPNLPSTMFATFFARNGCGSAGNGSCEIINVLENRWRKW